MKLGVDLSPRGAAVGFADVDAGGQQPVMLHDQAFVIAEVGDDALALVEVARDALEVVIADALVVAHGALVERQQPAVERGQRLAVDPLWPEQATIGGVLSTNDTGVLRRVDGADREVLKFMKHERVGPARAQVLERRAQALLHGVHARGAWTARVHKERA